MSTNTLAAVPRLLGSFPRRSLIAASDVGRELFATHKDGVIGVDCVGMATTPELCQSDAESEPISGMIGRSPLMREVYGMTRTVAKTSATVLLTGETGTGKELIARALHELSPRTSGPFVRVNCGALSENLLESELFGHRRGAFSGAIENRVGRFEAAHGGTILLDEINSLSYPLQVKLLRVLQEKELERVGDSSTIRVDVRVVAATNVDLEKAVQQNRFRADLLYRLNVIPINLPPMRERRDDIPDLVTSFLRRYAMANGVSAPHVPDDTLYLLQQYDWPGNVRELQNCLERVLVLSSDGKIPASLLPSHIRTPPQTSVSLPSGLSLDDTDTATLLREFVARRRSQLHADSTFVLEDVLNVVEKEVIQQVLRENFGIKSRSANRLGINRTTLLKKISDYALSAECR